MGKIKKLTDNKGDVIYPISVLAAIYKDENQTTEEWLQSVIDMLKQQTSGAVDELETALDAFSTESREKIDYYDNLAASTLEETTQELSGIVDQVQETADGKILEIETLSGEKKAEIEDSARGELDAIKSLAAQRRDDINNLADEKESEITELTESRKSGITTLADEKETEIEELATTEKGDVSVLSDQKQAEIESLADAIKQRLFEAETFIDEAHITSKIDREEGIHGLRFYDNKLSYKNRMEEWEDINFGGIVISPDEPSNQGAIWMDSSSGKNIPKYYNGEAWVLFPSVWS